MSQPQPSSRAAWQDRGQPPSPQREQSRRRRSRRRSPSVTSNISDSGSDGELPQSRGQQRQRRRNRRKQGGLPRVEERQVAQTAGNAVNTTANDEDKGSDKPLKLKLDLNLDADIRLTAKVHGDVTLALLR